MNVALTAVGWLDLGASVALAGGIFYAALIARPSEALLRWATGLLAVALVLDFLLVAWRMHELGGPTGLTLATDVLLMRWGRLWIARAVGLMVLVALLPRLHVRPLLLALLAAPWLLLRSLQGHAGAHGTFPALIDWLHLLAAATWLGTLLQVALRPDPPAAEVARRTRAAVTSALVVLVPAGAYAAFLHIPSLHGLVATAYGRTLLAKLGCFGILLLLGAENHFRQVPGLVAGEAAAGPRLLRGVRIEVLIGALVLLLSALLGVLPMPHTMPGYVRAGEARR